MEKEIKKENKERERDREREREKEKEKEKEKERERERESSEKSVVVEKKSSSKDSKRGDKDDSENRKRERGEKRRDRKVVPSSPTYPVSPTYHYNDGTPPDFYSPSSPRYEPNDRFYSGGYVDEQRERTDRDLSSISNSSKGSSNRRSQESPDHERELKRRRIDGSKVCLCIF